MTAGLRERKKPATRLTLHQAALQLVAEHGLDRVSIDDIAERADVSPRTFFNYFSSKDDAVVGLDPAGPQRQAEAFTNRPPEESPVQALRAVAVAQAAVMAEEPELWPLRLRVVEAHPALLARLTAGFGKSDRALAAAIAERTGTRADVDAYPLLLAHVAGAAMRSALHRWLATDFSTPLPALVDEAWSLLAAGLPAPTHRAT